MRGCKRFSIVALAGLAGQAAAQNEVVYTVQVGVPRADLSTAPSLAVGEEQIVILGSHRAMMFDKFLPIDPATALENRTWAGSTYGNYPFQPVVSSLPPFRITGLVFPTADYDPISGNVWMACSESDDSEQDFPEFIRASPERTFTCPGYLHLATSRVPDFTTFEDDPDGFVYASGPVVSPPPPPRTGGPAFNLSDPNIGKFRDNGEHLQFESNPQYLSFGFDTNDIFITAMDTGSCPGPDATTGQAILIIPRVFVDSIGPTTMHSGARPDESDITVVRMNGAPIIEDPAFHLLAVQEPFNQYSNKTLFISTDGAGGG